MANWFTRLFTRRDYAPQLEVRGDEGPDAHPMAATGYPEMPPNSMRESMSAYAQFPWVYACAESRADDLASLPLVVERKTKDGWERAEESAVLDLLARPVPSGRLGGMELRRQVYVDLALAGNCYLWIDSARNPKALRRLNPEDVKVSLDTMGLPVRYEVGTDRREVYPADQIIHITGATWGSMPGETAYGVSPVQVLKRLLNTEIAIMNSMQRQSKLTRPDAIMSPPDGQEWSPTQAKKLGDALREWQTSKGGTLMNPWGAKVEVLGHSPRDMEYQAGLERITSATLAVMGVPPTRVGLQSANYATAQQEAVRNWEKRQGEAALIDEALTNLCQRFTGLEDARVRHDFSGVDALQYTRTEKIQRVGQHILNGMDPADAYRMEGLDAEAEAMAGATQAAAPADPDRNVQRQDRAAMHMRAAAELLSRAENGLTPEEAADLRATIDEAQRLRLVQP